jgi:hypothetical protein
MDNPAMAVCMYTNELSSPFFKKAIVRCAPKRPLALPITKDQTMYKLP